ncbi:hypothetical protein CWB99_08880 [Pseudoalteromonas rubra]|uniref:Nucleotide-diphospho-sugar transferase domain-containing protein n=1 Tax=Pseudoalteromonas rubra TaxID=43658 RepID=A0A5S3WMH2_9GAMM|nr:hypothetical protein [Pseudoalteromonas rubra]TMP29302.1 hypothetical protein CWB99_08880 [Pseudoalteromonas rubra]TMP34093.1 hypothetical protein CWC00_09360 [Pseudoalteromonas rubra]
MSADRSHTLVFSVALNGYQWRYRRYLNSQRRYARRMGYDYVVVTRPWFNRLGAECCWLKLFLLKAALLSGYKQVLFVDADACIQTTCPALETLYDENTFLHLARGYSGAFNSGVMLMRNCARAIEWLDTLIAAMTQPVAESQGIGWGENGHVIHYANNCEGVAELDRRWNNTYDAELTDYIRHFNYGPLKCSWLDKCFHTLIFKCSRLLLGYSLSQPDQQAGKLGVVQLRIPATLAQIQRLYPRYFPSV